eukprot:Em0002g296a
MTLLVQQPRAQLRCPYTETIRHFVSALFMCRVTPHGDLVFVMGCEGMARAVWCADIRDLVQKTLVDQKTSSIYGLHGGDKKWKHVGDMPFACSLVDTLLLSDGGLLVVDGHTRQVLRITVQGDREKPIEADERLYEEAMSKGYVETSVTKCLILGAAGVGKTHLKHLLLKKDPPGQRVSTGLADNPVRAISFSLAGTAKGCGGTIRDGGVSMATSLEEVVSSFPKMTIHVSSDGAGAVHPDPTPARVNTTMDTSQQSRTVSIEEELIHHINHFSDKKKMFGVKWIHFIDSGGQLQYHDILPLFVQKPAVAIFVLNLSEELSHQPTIEYYGADGKPDARPLIITVGTHRDAADRRSESIEEKSQKLKALLDAGHFRIVCNGERLNKVLFAVNGKTPSDEDRHVAKVVLTKVSEIVEYHHKLLYRPDEGVAAKGDLHYTEGLFTPHDLLKLLVSVRGIAMVSGDEGGVYLMPALLTHLDSGQVTKYCQPGTSLIIMPSQGCIPSGLFCCLVAQLLSPTNHSPWKVCMERDKPLSLYRNCITFQLKHTTELVTLVDMFSYILLHIDTMSCKVCKEVRDCVHSGIKRTCGILKYQGVQFEDAFMCAGASCSSDPPHLATVVLEKKWKCSILGRQCGDLCEGQLMWFGESGVTKDSSATGTLPVSLDSEPSLQHLMEKVAAVIPSKYEMVGLQLGLTPAQLQAIRPQHQSLEDTTEHLRYLHAAIINSVIHQSLAFYQDHLALNQVERPEDITMELWSGFFFFLETAGKSLTLYMIGSSRLHREMLETSRVEIDELPASIPWIVFDKARTVVKLFHTRSVASQFQDVYTRTDEQMLCVVGYL